MSKKLEEEILLRLKKNLAEITEISESEITKNSIFRNDLGMDSLDKLELGYSVEEEFGIPLSDEDMLNKFDTLGDYVDYILAQKHYKK